MQLFKPTNEVSFTMHAVYSLWAAKFSYSIADLANHFGCVQMVRVRIDHPVCSQGCVSAVSVLVSIANEVALVPTKTCM